MVCDDFLAPVLLPEGAGAVLDLRALAGVMDWKRETHSAWIGLHRAFGHKGEFAECREGMCPTRRGWLAEKPRGEPAGGIPGPEQLSSAEAVIKKLLADPEVIAWCKEMGQK